MGNLSYHESCAFLIHELVTNSVKHAFPRGTSGTIRVVIQKKGDTILLSVEDTGVGFTGKMEQSSGLGLMIMRSMVQQLQGTLTMDGTAGMKVQVAFPSKA